MSKIYLYSGGQDSLSRLKYAVVSVLLASHAPGKRLLDILVSAVGFMEGYDANGLSLSSRFDDFSEHTLTSSLILAPYSKPLKRKNTRPVSTFQNVRPIVPMNSKATLSKLEGCITPMESTLKSLERSSVPCFRELSKLQIVEPGTDECVHKVGEISLTIQPTDMRRTDINQDNVVRVIDTEFLSSRGHFAKEEMVYRALISTVSPQVVREIFEIVLATGITLPRSIMHEFFDRISTEDKKLANDLAFLLNPEFQLSYHRFSVTDSKEKKDASHVWPFRFLNKHSQPCGLESQRKDNKKKDLTSRISRLQAVRNRGKKAP